MSTTPEVISARIRPPTLDHALLDVSRTLLAEASSHDVLRTVARHLAVATDVDLVGLFEPKADEGSVRWVASPAWDAAWCCAWARGSEWLASDGEPMLFAVVRADRDARLRSCPTLVAHGARSGLVVRIPHPCGRTAALLAFGRVERSFDEPARRFAEALALQLALSFRHEHAAAALAELEAKRAAAQRLEAIGRVAAGVAHDFNNLLTVVSANAELLIQSAPREPQLPMLESIRQASERAGVLTRQLVAFGRCQLVDVGAVSFVALFGGLEPVLRTLLGRSIELVVDLDPKAWGVKIDREQLARVIVNLVTNARDATPRGGVVSIRARVVDVGTKDPVHRGLLPGSYGVIEVEDRGVGIDPEHLPRIFDPYFTTKGTGRGTGLGLANVYGIVCQSGGTIEVESKLGEGALFRVLLPSASPGAVAPACKADQEPSAARTGGERVLVVEDDPFVRQLTARALASGGYQVLEASDGPSALGVLTTNDAPIDLVLSDVDMPGMAGTELGDVVAASRPDLPVLLMSGHASVLCEGGDPDARFKLLEKPFGVDELCRKVRESLDAARARRPGERQAAAPAA